jgi:hypothetical protein
MSGDPQSPPQEEPQVEIHKAKPVHNWREFLTELGVIVLGVCIALAAEQAVEWLHWRHQLAQAREVLASELSNNIAAGAERVVREHCFEERLDRLADTLDAASRSGTLPPVADIGYAPNRLWTRGAWTSVLNSQVASHFPREQLVRLATVYEEIQLLSENNQQEMVAWTNLSAMVGPGRRFDPVLDQALHAALGAARVGNRTMAIIGGQLVRDALRQDLPYSDEDRKSIADRIHRNRACRPLGTVVPPRYGQSPPSLTYLDVIRDWQKYPPYTGKWK